MQSICIALIVLDTFATFASLLPMLATENADSADPTGLSPSAEAFLHRLWPWLGNFLLTLSAYQYSRFFRSVIKSFAQFSLIFFLCEIAGTYLAFGTSVLGHVGYFVDTVVVASQIYLEVQDEGFGAASRLLNVLRLWRVARLVNYLVDTERIRHTRTAQKLATTEQELRKVEVELKRCTVDLRNEKEARGAIEDMLQGYKDEVDTLNEALKIAAMDIAEVAQANEEDMLSDDDSGDDLLDDDEEEDDDDETTVRDEVSDVVKAVSAKRRSAKNDRGEQEDDDDEEEDAFSEAATSAYDRSRNQEALIRLAQSDAVVRRSKKSSMSSASSVSSASGSVVNQSSSGVTFLINSDGSFEKK